MRTWALSTKKEAVEEQGKIFKSNKFAILATERDEPVSTGRASHEPAEEQGGSRN